jgi:hypothetical protein
VPTRSAWKRFVSTDQKYSYSRLIRMPKGPKGEKRPADVIGAAVKVMQIATG